MTDLEQKFLEKSRTEKGISEEDIKEIKNSDLDEMDKAALVAVGACRANLKNKDLEPIVLWRFIRYLTEIQMPLQITDFTYYLYPDNEAYFSKILTPTAYKLLQQYAQEMLDNNKFEDEKHKAHLEKIAKGEMVYGYSITLPKPKEEENE